MDNPDSFEHYRYHRIVNRLLFIVLFVVWNIIVYFHYIAPEERIDTFIEIIIVQFLLAVMAPFIGCAFIGGIFIFIVEGYKALVSWLLGY